MKYCLIPMLACRRASTGASVLSHIRYKANLITCNATSEKWQEYSKILCIFRAPKLFFPRKDYFGLVQYIPTTLRSCAYYAPH